MLAHSLTLTLHVQQRENNVLLVTRWILLLDFFYTELRALKYQGFSSVLSFGNRIYFELFTYSQTICPQIQ